jgi:hypothetical protein
MSKKHEVEEHKYCGTPLCCGKCLDEEAPANSVGTGGYTTQSDSTGPVAGYDPVIKFKGKIEKRIRAKVKMRKQIK